MTPFYRLTLFLLLVFYCLCSFDGAATFHCA